MSKDNSSTGVLQRKVQPQDSNAPLPAREKLPADLQKIVDDEDSLFEQLYDGTYVTCIYSLSMFWKLICDNPVPKNPRTPICVMLRMQVGFAQFFSAHNDMLPTLPILGNLSDPLLIHG